LATSRKPPNGAPVFLIDRRDPEVEKEMRVLENQLENHAMFRPGESAFKIIPPHRSTPKGLLQEMQVLRSMQAFKHNTRDQMGVWLASDTPRIVVGDRRRSWYWLPPVIWPENQEKIRTLVNEALKKGCRNFVLNSPWQQVFFPIDKSLNLWAGPFCNITNELAIEQLAGMHFKGVIVSPEQGKTDYDGLPAKSPLPLGIVVTGNWPLCVSRIIADDLKTDQLFNSPKGEQAWARQYGSDVWVFPNWPVDLISRKDALIKAGYKMLVHLSEPLPKNVKLKERPGLWNWEIGLK
jgi:putative protease